MPSNINSTEINRLCPYIIPRGWPGARSYLRVENIYVKLSYTENSIAGIAGNNICSENFMHGLVGEIMNILMEVKKNLEFILAFLKIVFMTIMDTNMHQKV